jgi:hypothetical protein
VRAVQTRRLSGRLAINQPSRPMRSLSMRAAMRKPSSLMRNSKSEAIQLAAISMILDRAFGRPKQEIPVENQGRTLDDMLRTIWAEKAQGRAEGDQAG